MKEIFLIFPHQLFENIENLKSVDRIFIIEDYLYFRQYKFHKQKLVLHRASMKFYEDYLRAKFKINNNKTSVTYLESEVLLKRKSLWRFLKDLQDFKNIKEIHVYELVDFYLEKDVREFCKENDIDLVVHKTEMFINSRDENNSFFNVINKNKKPFMKTFYEWQRKRLDILMEDTDGKKVPLGGKFSFDTENRMKLPKDYTETNADFHLNLEDKKYITEAIDYVNKNFKDNYGKLENEAEIYIYKISFAGAKKVLQNFLENKLKNFGIYEDAISSTYNFINHSVLTPYLNIGLLTPKYVIEGTLKFAKENNKDIPLNSLEGFIRQVIGWREFIRAMYDMHGVEMRNKNFWKHERGLEEYWWGDKEYQNHPNKIIDKTLNKTFKYAYNHHIERLMVIGNYMLLSEYDPNAVYEWFMTMYIDSYDWVMVPNVYGMSQFADGGIFATKPYVCASNYIIKMSDYKKEKEELNSWDKDFDEKFWSFLAKHKTYLSKNIRFKMLLSRLK